MSMKLVSVNIEGQKHLNKIRELLQRERADIVCMMEVFEDTLSTITKGYEYVEFAPGYLADQDEKKIIVGNRAWGEVLMSHYPLKNVEKIYLGKYSESHLPRHGVDKHTPVLVLADMVTTETIYRVGTVHGTWTKRGKVTIKQRREMGKLIQVLRGQELVLAGDFNIPRGSETYEKLLTNYRDNIPTEIDTTIDPILHYVNNDEPGKLKLVVDYVWCTPKYRVSKVRTISGVSDHCAIVCNAEKI